VIVGVDVDGDVDGDGDGDVLELATRPVRNGGHGFRKGRTPPAVPFYSSPIT